MSNFLSSFFGEQLNTNYSLKEIYLTFAKDLVRRKGHVFEMMCESVREIPNLYSTSFYEIEAISIYQNIPVIVIDAMLDWPELYDTNLQNFTEIFRLTRMRSYVPCYFLTNINLPSRYLSDYLELVSSPFMFRWLLTWKNCEVSAAKMIRLFYRQPYFMKFFLPVANVNWVILSNKYYMQHLKKIETEGRKLLVVMQLRGSMYFELKPIKNCYDICLSMNGTLHESQILMLSTELWQLHYFPNSDGINISIITENYLN